MSVDGVTTCWCTLSNMSCPVRSWRWQWSWYTTLVCNARRTGWLTVGSDNLQTGNHTAVTTGCSPWGMSKGHFLCNWLLRQGEGWPQSTQIFGAVAPWWRDKHCAGNMDHEMFKIYNRHEKSYSLQMIRLEMWFEIMLTYTCFTIAITIFVLSLILLVKNKFYWLTAFIIFSANVCQLFKYWLCSSYYNFLFLALIQYWTNQPRRQKCCILQCCCLISYLPPS